MRRSGAEQFSSISYRWVVVLPGFWNRIPRPCSGGAAAMVSEREPAILNRGRNVAPYAGCWARLSAGDRGHYHLRHPATDRRGSSTKRMSPSMNGCRSHLSPILTTSRLRAVSSHWRSTAAAADWRSVRHIARDSNRPVPELLANCSAPSTPPRSHPAAHRDERSAPRGGFHFTARRLCSDRGHRGHRCALPITLLLIIAGSLISQGAMNLWWAIAAAGVGSILGDQIGYAIGRWAGPAVVARSAASSESAPTSRPWKPKLKPGAAPASL